MLLQDVSPSCGASAEKSEEEYVGEEERRRGNGKKKIRKKMRVNHRLWRDVARSRAEKQTAEKDN